MITQDPAAMEEAAADPEPRRLSAPLLLGMLVIPALFVWLLLRRGYSRDIRIGGFLLAFAIPALVLVLELSALLTGG